MYMRRLFKRMAAAVLVSACLVSLSACSKTEEENRKLIHQHGGTPVEDAMGTVPSFYPQLRLWALPMNSW